MQKFLLQFFVMALLLISSTYATEDNISLSQARSSQILENLKILNEAGVDLTVYGQPSWFQAAKFGFTDVISFLVHKYIKIDEVEEKEGKTALHFASEMGHTHMVNLLLKEGACIDKKVGSMTSLKLAVFYGHTETVKKLLQYNVNPNENIKALHYATKGGHINIINFLLKAGFDINATEGWWDNSTALHVAAEYGEHEALKILIKNGAKLDPLCNGYTPIQLAAGNGHTALVRTLLIAGAKIHNVHKAAFNGEITVLKSFICLDPKFIHHIDKHMTALHYAALSGKIEVVKFLIENDVNIDGVYNNTVSPLHLATKNGHIDIIKILIERGAKINGNYTPSGLNANANSISAIFLAGGRVDLDLINFLVENGANINGPNTYNRFSNTDLDNFCYITALHHAAHKGYLETTRALINAGANINAIDYNWSPLHQAAEKGHNDIVLALVEAGASVNVVEKFHSWTPLHLAAKNGHFETVQSLILLGASYIIKDKNGFTAAMLAAENGHFLIEQFLLCYEK